MGKNRTTCILLDNGAISRNFFLELGRPQGDNISPNTFNFCMQILIFRLKLDPTIKCIPCIVPQLDNVPNLLNFFWHESNRETSKNEGLADDNSSLVLLEIASLQSIKTALREFGQISGLKCNYEKSVIMPFNVICPETILEIERLGFSVVDKIKLLRGAVKFKPENALISTRGTISKILHNIIIKH